MSYTVRFSEAAEEDMAELLEYLVPCAGDRVARGYLDKLIDYCATFEPERGLSREDVSPGLRIVGYHRKATIAFRIKGDIVTILRIYHGGRNLDLTDFEDTV
jgi:toxin ParE1/3/4